MNLFYEHEELSIDTIKQSLSSDQQLNSSNYSDKAPVVYDDNVEKRRREILAHQQFREKILDLITPITPIINIESKDDEFEYRAEITAQYISYQDSAASDLKYVYSLVSSKFKVNGTEYGYEEFSEFTKIIDDVLYDYFNDTAVIRVNNYDKNYLNIKNTANILSKQDEFRKKNTDKYALFSSRLLNLLPNKDTILTFINKDHEDGFFLFISIEYLVFYYDKSPENKYVYLFDSLSLYLNNKSALLEFHKFSSIIINLLNQLDSPNTHIFSSSFLDTQLDNFKLSFLENNLSEG